MNTGNPKQKGLPYLYELMKERRLLEEERLLLRVLAHLVRERFERGQRFGGDDHQQALAAPLKVPRQVHAVFHVRWLLDAPQILVRQSVGGGVGATKKMI